ATSEKLSIRYHSYEDVRFKDFMRGLLAIPLRKRGRPQFPRPVPIVNGLQPRSKKLTVKKLFQRLNAFMSRSTVVVADVGDALFGAIDLFIRGNTEFLGPAYYASMG